MQSVPDLMQNKHNVNPNWQNGYSPLSINVPNNACWTEGDLSPVDGFHSSNHRLSGTFSADAKKIFTPSGPLSEPGFTINSALNEKDHVFQCFVPKIVGCIDKNIPITRSNVLNLVSIIRCKHPKCNFVGMVHNSCMNHWMSCVGVAYKNSNLDLMRKHYECPKCEKPSLIRVDSSSKQTNFNAASDQGLVSPGLVEEFNSHPTNNSPEICSPLLPINPCGVNNCNGLRRITHQTMGVKRHSATSQYQTAKSPTDINGVIHAKRQVSLSGSGRMMEQFINNGLYSYLSQNGSKASIGLQGIEDISCSSGTSGFVSANCPSLSSLSLSNYEQFGVGPGTPSACSSATSDGAMQPRTLRSISEHQGSLQNANFESNNQSSINSRLSAGCMPSNNSSLWRPGNLPAIPRRNPCSSNNGSQFFGMWSPNEAFGNSALVSPQGKNVGKFAGQNLGSWHINEKGNIFQQRKNVDMFEKLPKIKQNTYFIQSEDDSCTGNEDLRTFLLTQLTNKRVCDLPCLACGKNLVIFDHFPVIDGLLFLSPICHLQNGGTVELGWNSQINANFTLNNSSAGCGILVSSVVPPPGCSGPRQQQSSSDGHFHHRNIGGRNGGPSIRQERHLHAMCLVCATELTTGSVKENKPESSENDSEKTESIKFLCKFCRKPWNGSSYLVGGLYTYDIFAAQPCCLDRLKCKSCGSLAINASKSDQLRNNQALSSQEDSFNTNQLYPLPYFSQYSMKISCQQCNDSDFHFVREFNQIYTKVVN